MTEKIGETTALCPDCLRTIPAVKIAEGDNVYIEKTCPEHGTYKVLIWKGKEDYIDLYRYEGVNAPPKKVAVEGDIKDCPQECGLCKEHKQHTCLAIVEVTNGCNMNCPVCFARSNTGYRFHPDMDVIRGMFQTVVDYVESPRCVQISGGEPTIRDDLPDIIRMAKEMGIEHIEVNTNALRLANDLEYLRSLKEAGADSLYMSFDGLNDEIYEKTCGRPMLDVKKKAIENAAKIDMGVTLVAVVSPNINLDQVGEIIDFAISKVPTVKGVHFQPIAYFGRYPIQPKDEDRVMLPDLLKEIEVQTKGQLRAENFVPTSCANVHCDAKSLSVVLPDGSLFPMTHRAMGPPKRTDNIAEKTRTEMANLWRFIEESMDGGRPKEDDGDSWKDFLKRAKTNYLTVSTMPFQDVWMGEVERWSRCCIHIVTPDGKLIPFCLFNVNNKEGETLYRHQVFSRFGESI